MGESKYGVGVNAIRKMSDDELDKFIKLGTKTINYRYKRNTNILGEKAEFSEYVETFKETSGRFYGETKYFSGAVKEKSRSEKQQIAYAINVLSSIKETPTDVLKEFEENLKNIFKDPETTKKVLNSLESEQIIQIGRDNIELIYDLLGSERVNKAAQSSGDDSEEFYRTLIQKTSQNMHDYLSEEEIEKVVEQWDIPK